MKSDAPSAVKRIVDQLNFGARTAARVAWTSWEFTVAGANEIVVCNASYGFEKDDHRYTVTVEEKDGVPVPVACDCPADQYNERYSCKHRVASATVGGLPLLRAAVGFSPTTSPRHSATVEILRTDGGVAAVEIEPDECPNGDPLCDGPDGDDLPCFDCFQIRGGA